MELLLKTLTKDKAKVIAVVQARMGSTRLPNKMMLWLKGEPICNWINKRLCNSQRLENIVFAIPTSRENDVLARYLLEQNVCVFRGSENDVLERFYDACKPYKPTHIIRVCGDNPLICSTEIDNLIDNIQPGDDYIYNHIPRNNNYPDGLGAECITLEALETINSHATRASHREHIFNYIWDNPNNFKIKTFDPPDPHLWHPELKLDLDTVNDYERLLSLRIHLSSTARDIVTAATSQQDETR